jgi:hypothetical protein
MSSLQTHAKASTQVRTEVLVVAASRRRFFLFPQIAKTPALQNRAVLISGRGGMVSSILEEEFKLMR